ncbi:MAG: NAD(P)-binding domain-containing protein [Candidatus Omnitrophica bacterium]|nr:NAD(P)-binding domain-containing protein [Candidatus Omnitrophota bacterium]
MDAKDLTHIRISRIVAASKWRVIRLLTKISEFSRDVSTIQEVSILQKTRNVVKTKWRILADGIPINWVEEDTIALRDHAIHFRAVEGDLEEFRGTWQFQDHKEGTQLNVDVYLNVGIPAIKEFADDYVKKIVTKNFIAIINALERRLISVKYTSLKDGNADKVAGFAILGHPYNFAQLERNLKMLNPNFKIPSQEFLKGLFGIAPSFKMYEMDEFKSATGETTRGKIILCTFIPDMVAHDIEAVYSKVVYACRLAEKFGMGIVTLGGFTSIVGERFGTKIREEVDIPITTGNTFTAALAIDGVEKAAQLLRKDLKDLKIAVVGGTGDIGAACARAFALKAKQVTITGRTKSNLRALAGELKRNRKANIEAMLDNEKAVRDADAIIAAASVSAAILNINWFKPGAIVCDLAYPKNISYMTSRKDIFVFSGGMASLPSPIDTAVDMGAPSPGVSYGCFCEVIILALERRFENYSYGRGNITLEKIDEIRKMGLKHGFTLSPFYWANREIDEKQVAELIMAAK